MTNVLVVDDEAGVRYTLREILTERGYQVTCVESAAAALPELDECDVVITDFAMPNRNGLQLLDDIVARDPQLPVILLTAQGSEKVAAEAIKHGAYDYVTKPFDIDELVALVARADETQRLRNDNRRLAAERALGRRIVGESAVMRRLLEATTRLAGRDVTVLVCGETGTGKEFVAELLHVQSARRKQPLVRFNCAALPAELAESELFGHARGAFTGASLQHQGFFSQADGGTLVLDEVGELAPSVQGKLLRVLQEGEIQPLGSGRVEKVNVRVVASTNRDLRAEVAAGRFREDLFYRLAVVELTVPPLRDRSSDIPALVEEFARRAAERFGLGVMVIEPALIEALALAPWPGNVRQLENAVARLAALSSNNRLTLADFTAQLTTDVHGEGPDVDAPEAFDEAGPSLREQVEAFERGVLTRALERAGGNQSKTARQLGVSRVTLIDKLKKYGLTGKFK